MYDNESVDEDLQLAPDTLSILQEFLREKEERDKQEQGLLGSAKFEENWQLSQFWYDSTTKQKLVEASKHLTNILELTPASVEIGLLSCPSLYTTFKNIFSKVKIFEYDKRFSAYDDDFVFYDYSETESIVEKYTDFQNKFDIIILDPPFLSEECIKNISKYVEYLSKNNAKTILCSGLVVKEWAESYLNLKLCNFEPQHERNLGNAFVSYANFNLDDLID